MRELDFKSLALIHFAVYLTAGVDSAPLTFDMGEMPSYTVRYPKIIPLSTMPFSAPLISYCRLVKVSQAQVH
jgi:hypothetical protein